MTPRYRAITEKATVIRFPASLMRKVVGMLAALTVSTFQTHAGSLDWLFDVFNHDDAAREQAQFLVWDGVSHSVSARFDKVKLIDKNAPFYLFHVIMISPGAGAESERSSYLVCFKLAENKTEFHIVTVIQYASDPPTEHEIMIDKRLNGWPAVVPLKATEDLPRNIKPPGLSIVLDKCRGGSEQ